MTENNMRETRLKVLVVSYLPWRNDVSVGNTLSNLFNGLQDRIEYSFHICKYIFQGW